MSDRQTSVPPISAVIRNAARRNAVAIFVSSGAA
jgi:hypothetical protein